MRRILLVTLLIAGCAAPAGSAEPTPASGVPSVAPTPIATRQPTPSPSADPIPSLTASPSAPPSEPATPVAWARIRPEGDTPEAREDHTWTVAGDGATAYLFGGRDGDRVRGDLWSYELAADRWNRLRPAGDAPEARFGHEATWVDGLGLVVFAGQAGPTTFFGDLHVYDPAAGAQGTWRRLPGRGDAPVPRYGSCMALGPDGRLWISHGFTEDGTRFADTRAYDLATETWSDETPGGTLPVARCLHGCWFGADGRLVLYAGQTTGVAALGDLWTLASPGTPGAAWTRHDATLPADRRLYAHAALADGRHLVFGGGGLGGRFHDDLFTLAAGSLAATAVTLDGDAPPLRAAAELIVDAGRERILLFGGKDGTRRFGDLWTAPIPAQE